MDIIWINENKIWKLKEIRDDIYHHIDILQNKISNLSIQITKIAFYQQTINNNDKNKVYVGFNRFKRNKIKVIQQHKYPKKKHLFFQI